MHVLTILDQPNPASFSHAVAARFMDGVKAAGHTAELADLHAEGFHPVWQMADFEADFENSPDAAPGDVRAEQARIERADALAMVFPLWWWGMPSMLKGWMDRVFAWGWAYDQLDDPTPAGSMLRERPCVLLVPAGAAPDEMEAKGYRRSIETLWLEGTLGYFGLRTELRLLYGSTGKPFRREAHLETAYRAGLDIGRT